jgi:hypothetical protein
MWVEPQKPEIT